MLVKKALEYYDIFDGSIVRHGFTKYFRDYKIEAYDGGGNLLLFLFRGCVEVKYQLTLPEKAFSVDDVFINRDEWEKADAPVGYLWDTHAVAYPGLKYNGETESVKFWEKKLALKMHDVTIETNVFSLNLVFHDLTVQED